MKMNESEWSSIIQEEIQAELNQPIAEEECDFTIPVILISVLAILTVLVAAMGLCFNKLDSLQDNTRQDSCAQRVLRVNRLILVLVVL